MSRVVAVAPTELAATKPVRVPGRQHMRLWRRVSLRRQMLYGFALPVVIVLLASFYVSSALESIRGAARASDESSGAIGLRYALLNRVVDSETGLRGFLLSSDPEFLRPYDEAPAELASIGSQLEVTDAPEPEHIRKLRAVEALYRRWRVEFADPLIRLRRATPVDVGQRVEQLAALASKPVTLERQRALDHAREQLQAALAKGQGDQRATELAALLERMETDTQLDPAAQASLQALVLAYQTDETRITTTIQSRQGKRIIDAIRGLMEGALRDERAELQQAVDEANAVTERARWIARLAPVAALVIGLSLVLLLLVDAIRAITATTKAAAAVADGDLDKRIDVMRADEVGELGLAFNRMAAELAVDRRRNALQDRFQTLLVTSNTLDELYQVVARMCAEMFPRGGGAIYRIAASRNIAEMVTQWGWPDDANGRLLEPDECRALRTGQPYFADAQSLELPCRHTERIGHPVSHSLCLPLAAQGETLGILQLCRFTAADEAGISASAIETAVLISEQFAMALANLQLREQLRNQSIRDPLTGLFNRRYLEETMERELARSMRNARPLAVAAIDVDHFKRFNDTHGHDAGDKVLVELAGLMRASIRSTDIACRYGGEEFVLLMPDTPIDVAMERVTLLRDRARTLRARMGSVELESATISVGLAVAPEHGTRADLLLRNADIALYRAKADGRDRVVLHESSQDAARAAAAPVAPGPA